MSGFGVSPPPPPRGAFQNSLGHGTTSLTGRANGTRVLFVDARVCLHFPDSMSSSYHRDNHQE